jgi:DNA repair protein RadD
MKCHGCGAEYDRFAQDDGGLYCPRCSGEEELTPLPHQVRALDEVRQAVVQGYRRIVVTGPTGSGKSLTLSRLVKGAAEKQKRVVVYTNRNMLASQLSGNFEKWGIEHGIRGAVFEEKQRLTANIQISMIQTEESKVYKQEKWKLHEASLVIVDECHQMASGAAEKILGDHAAQGAVICGFTATPIGLGGLYEKLIVAGTNSEMRQCGLHVPCITYGPDEPDLSFVKKQKVADDLFASASHREMYVQQVFGSVIHHYKQLNPWRRPGILFAPGVKESMWFVDQFKKHGVKAAHIDGSDVYLGEWEENERKLYKSSNEKRDEVLDKLKSGEIHVVCNRFVLREGIDIPELYHAIMANVFGSESAFIQSGGRLLRSHPSLDHVVLQDHGGNWWRWGSLNENRHWTLGDTDESREREQRKARERGDEDAKEPICCPKCHGLRLSGDTCPHCGHRHKRSVRFVMQANGDLKQMNGPVTKKKKQFSDAQKLWNSMYYAARNGAKRMHTFADLKKQFQGRYRQPLPADIGNAPPPGHAAWELPVADVAWKDLQKAQPIN